MANVAKTAAYVPKGVNQGRHFFVKVDLGADTLANTDTLTISLPTGVEKEAVPVGVHTYLVTGTSWARDTDVPLTATTHDTATGVTVLTATGNVAANTIVFVEYLAV